MPRRILFALLLVLCTSLSAFGIETMTINVTGDASGTYCYDAGTECSSYGTDLVAQGVDISSLDTFNTPLNPAVSESIQQGSLSLNTGSFIGLNSNNQWVFAGPGALNITGCINGVTGSGTGHACQGTDYSDVLVSDDFTGATLDPPGSGGEAVEMGNLSGTLNTLLAQFYGISTVFTAASESLDIVLPSGTVAGGAFSGGYTNFLTTNELTLLTTVPEDRTFVGTMGVLFLGLAVFGLARRSGLIRAL